MVASLSEIDNEKTDSDSEMDTDEELAALESTDSGEELSDMDTSSGPLANYDTDPDASAPSLQCESCCHSIHVCRLGHELTEWQSSTGEWIKTNLKDSGLCLKYPTLCGVCDRVLAEQGGRLLRSALWCQYCEYGVMCQSCCFKKHAKAPLHPVKTWANGRYWKTTSLRKAGFVYQMGHGGATCPHPDRHLSSLLVIAHDGVPEQRGDVEVELGADSEERVVSVDVEPSGHLLNDESQSSVVGTQKVDSVVGTRERDFPFRQIRH
ncbi:hypothetical protein DFH06DRAFT_1152167 [Mycena polygramma]|nr:hypothetical protein DFH06DRAFT_1154202 [Mycena polygramma]KAJ7603095.1 hypothetical protein DFH06DRAFT_1152167 [Mycena polygramma]